MFVENVILKLSVYKVETRVYYSLFFVGSDKSPTEEDNYLCCQLRHLNTKVLLSRDFHAANIWMKVGLSINNFYVTSVSHLGSTTFGIRTCDMSI